MPYQNIEELADLVARGEGSLVASVVKNNDENIERLFKKLRLGMVVCMYSMKNLPKKVQVMVHHFLIWYMVGLVVQVVVKN
jgi:acyl-CoA reductase-like NAD-dependent aldehyde dehydrogenase